MAYIRTVCFCIYLYFLMANFWKNEAKHGSLYFQFFFFNFEIIWESQEVANIVQKSLSSLKWYTLHNHSTWAKPGNFESGVILLAKWQTLFKLFQFLHTFFFFFKCLFGSFMTVYPMYRLMKAPMGRYLWFESTLSKFPPGRLPRI